MGGFKYGELILDAIDQLRKRKARPDLDRICHMLERRHGLKSAEVNEDLAKMVSDGIVIKVDYKGNTSYRNAAKWVRTKSLFRSYFNTSDLASAVQEAVDAISCPGGSSDIVHCASLHDIEKYLLKRETTCNMNIATLRSALEKEVANGTIRQVRIGEYVSVIPRISDHTLAEGPLKTVENDTFDNNKSHVIRKRLKVPEVSANIQIDAMGDFSCGYCLFAPGANRLGAPEGLLVCCECGTKVHPSCADYFGESAVRIMLTSWLCGDCKVCLCCYENYLDDVLQICHLCDKAYHPKCYSSSCTSDIDGKWYCNPCMINGNYETEPANLNSSNPSPIATEVAGESPSSLILKKCLKEYPKIVPVADDWTIDEVEGFLKGLGFHDEAPVFREQEIDGQSLMLLKRDDVLTGLSMKLGPALKIYRHIMKLQHIPNNAVDAIFDS